MNSTLSWLGLDNNEIGEGGSRVIADFLGSDRSRGLQRIHLIDANIGDAGVALIAQALKGQRSLHMLLIGGNSITNTGLTAIADMLRENSTLSVLEVDSIPSTDAPHHPVAIECSLGLKAIGEALRDVPRPKVGFDCRSPIPTLPPPAPCPRFAHRAFRIFATAENEGSGQLVSSQSPRTP